MAAFTGVVDVTSSTADSNPLVWTREVRTAMLQRNIPPELWTQKCVTCLARRVADRFVSSRAGSDVGAITQRFVGHVADPFADTPWDVFVDWLLHASPRCAAACKVWAWVNALCCRAGSV